MTDEELIARLRDRTVFGTPTATAAADRIEALKAELKSVLDRESATYVRHDAKVERLEAAIREAALREALKALDSLPEYGSPDVNIGVSNAYSAILTLIPTKGDDHD